jgi:hypothetical protein
MSTQSIQKREHEFEIYGRFYRVGVVAQIWPDEWSSATRLEASNWDRAEFYLPSFRYEGVVAAVNVEVTGRTFQHRPYSDQSWVRVQIEFVGDGDDPSVFVSGWWHPEGAW